VLAVYVYVQLVAVHCFLLELKSLFAGDFIKISGSHRSVDKIQVFWIVMPWQVVCCKVFGCGGGGRKLLQNVDNYLPIKTAAYPRKFESLE
jgi:hypothetical protein